MLLVFLEIPEYPCDLPMDRHPGSKGTEMIHARNFRVQPQAIMGSSIAEQVTGSLEEVGQQMQGKVGVTVHPE